VVRAIRHTRTNVINGGPSGFRVGFSSDFS
jgi:hypothetical protein